MKTTELTIGAEIKTKIESALAQGGTVYVSTMTHATKVNAKAAAKFKAAGHDLFKLDASGDLLMASGKNYNKLTIGDKSLVGFTFA